MLEHLAAPLLRGQPDPRHEREAIACEAAVGAERLHGADEAGALAGRAVGQHGDERERLVDHRREREIGAQAQADDAHLERLRYGLALHPAFDAQGVDAGVGCR
ncbi:hypothetical protein J2W32_003540 [Variovorax boronicumulans]|uniref:Uncharacterized protein n=1 Tax=Variovorax boronicumulans TaxID=436515 RepID=A0AAW8D374_9BURK|nr:hypothetical protein [Variovorax boronicumulans]MDQ0054483.1 hypothetical protein [Variovorax boronicumulans]